MAGRRGHLLYDERIRRDSKGWVIEIAQEHSSGALDAIMSRVSEPEVPTNHSPQLDRLPYIDDHVKEMDASAEQVWHGLLSTSQLPETARLARLGMGTQTAEADWGMVKWR